MVLHKNSVPESVSIDHALSAVLICRIVCKIIYERYYVISLFHLNVDIDSQLKHKYSSRWKGVYSKKMFLHNNSYAKILPSKLLVGGGII